jgi:hypothetical protein
MVNLDAKKLECGIGYHAVFVRGCHAENDGGQGGVKFAEGWGS